MAVNSSLYQSIIDIYNEYIGILSPIKSEPRYAVQGDISNCNLYQNSKGAVGIFDYNRCGDNNLYCDAVMQAIYEARLMDYPDNYRENHEHIILPAFLKGYHSERPFSDVQKSMYPYLCAIIKAFWSMDIKWNENSLLCELEQGNIKAVHRWLEEIKKRLLTLEPMNI